MLQARLNFPAWWGWGGGRQSEYDLGVRLRGRWVAPGKWSPVWSPTGPESPPSHSEATGRQGKCLENVTALDPELEVCLVGNPTVDTHFCVPPMWSSLGILVTMCFPYWSGVNIRQVPAQLTGWQRDGPSPSWVRGIIRWLCKSSCSQSLEEFNLIMVELTEWPWTNHFLFTSFYGCKMRGLDGCFNSC